MIHRRDEGQEVRHGFNYGKSSISKHFNTFVLSIPWLVLLEFACIAIARRFAALTHL